MLPFQIGRIFFRDCLFSTEASRCQLLSKWRAEPALAENSQGSLLFTPPVASSVPEHLELRICFGFRISLLHLLQREFNKVFGGFRFAFFLQIMHDFVGLDLLVAERD